MANPLCERDGEGDLPPFGGDCGVFRGHSTALCRHSRVVDAGATGGVSAGSGGEPKWARWRTQVKERSACLRCKALNDSAELDGVARMVRAGGGGGKSEADGDVPVKAGHGHGAHAEQLTATAQPTREQKRHHGNRYGVPRQPGLQRHGDRRRQAAGQLGAGVLLNRTIAGRGAHGAVLTGAQCERGGAVGQAAGADGGAAGRVGGRPRGGGAGGGGGGGGAGGGAGAACSSLRLKLRRSERGARGFAPARTAHQFLTAEPEQ
ncbi:basic proline-rich protein [Gracilaria domingensis]|nr:basic proline-rich protein [Gracilaria domingensis]